MHKKSLLLACGPPACHKSEELSGSSWGSNKFIGFILYISAFYACAVFSSALMGAFAAT